MNFINVALHLLLYCQILAIVLVKCIKERQPIHGVYTNNINSYQLLVPYRINNDGEIESFHLPQFFQHDYQSRRKKRDLSHPGLRHYNFYFNGKDHHIQLWPNQGFLSPDVVSEFHYPGSEMTVENRRLKRLNSSLCHYTGNIKDDDESSVALSLCKGVAGYVKTKDDIYFIEPVKEFGPNELGHHLHVIHEQDSNLIYDKLMRKRKKRNNCGAENSYDGWKRAFNYHFEKTSPNSRNRRDITLHPLHRFLEILVVADKQFLNFHKDKDYENYIMTVMNMVSDYFHDASLGNQYDVTVVRIIYLNENISAIDFSKKSSKNADKILKAFCRWQYEVNPKDLEHPQHHDIAILITRHDICSAEGNEENCDLLGLAYMASACIPSDACAVTEDKGLILGVVIAHEIGHIMGCQHDADKDDTSSSLSSSSSGCPAMVNDKFYHVMSPHISLAATIWSTCSRAYMKELLKNNLGDCLADEPLESSFVYDEMLPGIIYDADYQCNLIFPNSSHCRMNSEKFCQQLFCRVASTKCWSNNEPPAEGTKCGFNKWCSRQQCVPIGQRVQAIDGGWSGWSKYSSCSRTCGGGVQVSERSCNRPAPINGGLYCQGSHKRYKICNTNFCPEEIPSFRAIQCSQYDTVPSSGKFHQWKPYFPLKKSSENTCVLYCINEENMYMKLSPRARDGTPCKAGTNDMCIAGVCRKVGCDWELDSDAVDDKCGVCNGDNSGCKRVYGQYTAGGSGFSLMVSLPRGARNVIILENGPSDNALAVSDKKKDFFLRPGDIDGEKRFGQNIAFYRHSVLDREELYIAGPLQQILLVYVVFNEPNNIGFSWEYYIRDKNWSPKQNKSSGKNKKFYHWDYVDWTTCSVRCDSGIKKSEPYCISSSLGGIVASKFCSDIQKPETKVKICNREPCKIRWRIGDWSVCTGCIHKPGIRVRRVWCGQQSPRWEENDIITDDEKCISAQGTKPETKQLCTGECTEDCKRIHHGRNTKLRKFVKRGNNSNKSCGKSGLDNKFYKEYYKVLDFIDLNDKEVYFGREQKWLRSGMPQKHKLELGIMDLNEAKNALNMFEKRNKQKRGKFRNYEIADSIQKNNFKITRNIRNSVITKPNHSMVADDILKTSIIEASYIDAPVTNLSDEAYQKYGDKIFGRIDLSHMKIFNDKNEICEMMKKYTNGSLEEDTEKNPTDNVDIPDYDD